MSDHHADDFARHEPFALVQGKTAAELWRDLGIPETRGGPAWLGNQLEKAGCRFRGGLLGASRSRLFDEVRARQWLEGEGRSMIEAKLGTPGGHAPRAKVPGIAAE